MKNYLLLILTIAVLSCSGQVLEESEGVAMKATPPEYVCDNGRDSFVLPVDYDACVMVCDAVTGTGYDTEPDTGTGYDTEPDTGTGYDTEPDTDTGYDTEPDTDTGYDTEPDTETGYDTEPDTDTGYDTEPDTDTGYDTEVDTDFFTIIVMPDTQNYISWKPAVFVGQTQWIADNAESLNVKMVVHVGDLVGNNSDSTHWTRGSDGMQTLDDADVPYSISIGNHDQYQRDSTNFNTYFPQTRFQDMVTYGGAREIAPVKSDNTFHTFNGNGVDYLLLTLEFGPRDVVLEWASSVVASHPGHRVILSTHAYLNESGDRATSGDGDGHNPRYYGLGECNDGQQIWDEFVDLTSNIDFVLCGHVTPTDGAAMLTSETQSGNTVHQMVTNYQYNSAAKGALRILKFYPDRVEATTYSPYLHSGITDANNQFTIPL